MGDKRDKQPGPQDDAKGHGNEQVASVLLTAVPSDVLESFSSAQEGDPRDPPAARKINADRPNQSPPDIEPPDASMLELMARAQVAWVGAGVRYWGEMAELFGRRGANIADMARMSDRDLDQREKLRLLDEARGYLREVGEISMREARALSDDMAKLEAALRKTQAKPPRNEPKRDGRPT